MNAPQFLTLFLCGDVMLGRGVDQILPYPSDPVIHENYLTNALQYVQLAENKNGIIGKPVDFKYVWGEALSIMDAVNPKFRIINLETSVTTNNDWMHKGINYRMNPKNIDTLVESKIDVSVLANNHVLDWGEEGLFDTLETLHEAEIKTAGAGIDKEQSSMPAILNTSTGRVLVFSYASPSSGVPKEWSATDDKAGINFISEFSPIAAKKVKEDIERWKKTNDIVILSIHWGDNWGYAIPEQHRKFAHYLLQENSVDLIHGHSSHHIKGIELFNKKLIIYGCGDFINDYEGIQGHEQYRSDLPVMFFPTLDYRSGELIDLTLIPLQLRKFTLQKANSEDILWLKKILNREGEKLGTRFRVVEDQTAQPALHLVRNTK
ncbi:MAG: CapA family protein [Bdellovibrio sp.]